MQVFPDTPAARFIHGFWALRHVLVAQVSPVLREAYDLEIPEVLLLEYIGNSSLSPSEIAEAMKIPPHAISRKLDGLEKRKLIVRSLDPDDARRRVLELTPAGETLLQEAAALLEQRVTRVLSVLPPDTVSSVIAAFDLITRKLPDSATSVSASVSQPSEAP